MAYVSGTANDLAALRTAIINACTANGWTLSGSVLSKGSLYLSIAVNGNFLDIQGGTESITIRDNTFTEIRGGKPRVVVKQGPDTKQIVYADRFTKIDYALQ